MRFIVTAWNIFKYAIDVTINILSSEKTPISMQSCSVYSDLEKDSK